MQIEANQMWTYWEWLFPKLGLLQGTVLVIGLAFIGFIVSYLISLARNGPTEGFYAVSDIIAKFFRDDLPGTSLRRIFAIAKLSIQEAIRRKVVAVFAVFVVGLLFAGWYLDPNADDPAKLYISFVMTSINYLMLLLGLFLSSFSLPADIKNKTIYTVVTKPVRATEIILGRVVGFVAVGTVLLLAMGLLSYVFVVRGVRHTHEVETVESNGKRGKTSFDALHSHNFTITSTGEGVTDEVKGHRHVITVREVNGEKVYETGPAEGALQARIPVFGKLRYTDRDGSSGQGINVGYESTYRKHIEGGTLASAIYTFDNVNESRFGEVLRTEMSIIAFRTYKGDIETGVRGHIVVRNPNGKVESDRIPFIVKEFQVDQISIPRELDGFRDGQPAKIDLYKDLVEDGKIEIVVRCNDQGQYFGMAPADVYLRAGESSFAWNFFKGFLGVWFQLIIIVSLGVMFSTFLTGPVSMIATMSSLALGFFGSIASDALSYELVGGGPLESSIRIVTQTSATVPLDLGSGLENAIKGIDNVILLFVSTLANAIPNFQALNTSDFVAYGINVFGDLVARHATMTLGYVILTTVMGYFFLKSREIGA